MSIRHGYNLHLCVAPNCQRTYLTYKINYHFSIRSFNTDNSNYFIFTYSQGNIRTMNNLKNDT